MISSCEVSSELKSSLSRQDTLIFHATVCTLLCSLPLSLILKILWLVYAWLVWQCKASDWKLIWSLFAAVWSVPYLLEEYFWKLLFSFGHSTGCFLDRFVNHVLLLFGPPLVVTLVLSNLPIISSLAAFPLLWWVCCNIYQSLPDLHLGFLTLGNRRMHCFDQYQHKMLCYYIQLRMFWDAQVLLKSHFLGIVYPCLWLI